MRLRYHIVALTVAAGLSYALADETLYRYEGDVHPTDESAGWVVGNLCDDPCVESVEDGHFREHGDVAVQEA